MDSGGLDFSAAGHIWGVRFGYLFYCIVVPSVFVCCVWWGWVAGGVLWTVGVLMVAGGLVFVISTYLRDVE